MVGATFKGMCYMDGMCFAMLTPMLYISGCRKICGVIRGKGFTPPNDEVHSARLSLPHIECAWEGSRSDPQAPLAIFPFSWCVSGGGLKVSLCVNAGIQVGGLFANGPKQMCFEPYVDTMGERSYIPF